MPVKKPTPFVALRRAEDWVSEQISLVGDEDGLSFAALTEN